MDYRTAVFSDIFSLLNGNITAGGNPVYVGTKIPDTEDTFIRYYVQSDEDIGTRDAAVRELSILFDCVTRQPMSMGDDSLTDEMVAQIQELLLNESNYTLTDGWKMAIASNQGTDSDSGEFEGYYMNIRTFNLKLIIQKYRT
jgi:hypothetical protein